MAALYLAGIFFNIRMLQSCFKNKTKYKFLQKCRTLTVLQCACQVTILVADAVESWKGFDFQPTGSCNVFRVLASSMLFFQGCNLLVICIIYFDHSAAHGNRDLCSKLKISATLSLGFIGSVMIWWQSCFSPEFISQMALTVMFIVAVAFVVLLFVEDARNLNIQDSLEDTMSPESSMKTCSLLWKEQRRPIIFINLLLTCLVVILSGSPHWTENEAFKETLHSFMTKFVVGVILPVTYCDLIESSYEELKENKIEFVVI